MTKYILCMPEGGLNDMLCQIEVCAKYGKRFGRKTLVYTSRNPKFRESLGLYFQSEDPEIAFISELEMLSQLSMFPAELNSRNLDWSADSTGPAGEFCLSGTQIQLQFDRTIDYVEDVIVHQQAGGGLGSLQLLSKISFTPPLLNMFVASKELADSALYDGIHVRNSDYRTNYKEGMSKFFSTGLASKFVASDSATVLEFAKEEAAKSGKKLIHPKSNLSLNFKNVDVMNDLVLLAASRRLTVLPIDNALLSFSGYSRLAKFIWLVIAIKRNPLVLISCGSKYGIADSGSKFVDFVLNHLYYFPVALLLRVFPRGLYRQVLNL